MAKILNFILYTYYRLLFEAADRKLKKKGFLSSSEFNIYQEAKLMTPYYKSRIKKKSI